MLEAAIRSKTFNIRDIQVIHGTLVHIAFVFPDGSSHLPVISNFMSKFHGHEFLRFHVSDAFIQTLQWWRQRLTNPLGFRQLHPIGPVLDYGIFVDASTTWGIGIIIGDLFHAFQLAPNWKLLGRDICWLETLALELAFYFFCQLNFHSRHILIHSDNNGAIGAHSKGRSPNLAINLSVRRSFNVLSEMLIIPDYAYITSEDNPADPISRGESGFPNYSYISQHFDMLVELQDIFLND